MLLAFFMTTVLVKMHKLWMTESVLEIGVGVFVATNRNCEQCWWIALVQGVPCMEPCGDSCWSFRPYRSKLCTTSMLKLLNLSTRPSCTKLRLPNPALRATSGEVWAVFSKLLPALCGGSVFKGAVEGSQRWNCQGAWSQGRYTGGRQV